MPLPCVLSLSTEQHAELVWVRDRDPKAYLRERAAAILKVAAGQSVRAVARTGLFRSRHHDTVGAWIQRYQAEGVDGLRIRPGRGRKPAFSPSDGPGGRH